MDKGTHESLLEATTFIETIENRKGLKINYIEKIAFRKGFTDEIQLEKVAQPLLNSGCGEYLIRLVK